MPRREERGHMCVSMCGGVCVGKRNAAESIIWQNIKKGSSRMRWGTEWKKMGGHCGEVGEVGTEGE